MNEGNINEGAEQTKEACDDSKCPFHSNLKLKEKTLTGAVSSAKMKRTATVVIERKVFAPKYERYEAKTSKIKAHNPDCIAAKQGDAVKLQECRPLSKTKHFVIIEKLGEK